MDPWWQPDVDETADGLHLPLIKELIDKMSVLRLARVSYACPALEGVVSCRKAWTGERELVRKGSGLNIIYIMAC